MLPSTSTLATRRGGLATSKYAAPINAPYPAIRRTVAGFVVASDKMLTNKKVKDFFNKNIAAL